MSRATTQLRQDKLSRPVEQSTSRNLRAAIGGAPKPKKVCFVNSGGSPSLRLKVGNAVGEEPEQEVVCGCLNKVLRQPRWQVFFWDDPNVVCGLVLRFTLKDFEPFYLQ